MDQIIIKNTQMLYSLAAIIHSKIDENYQWFDTIKEEIDLYAAISIKYIFIGLWYLEWFFIFAFLILL